jgi:hypothetical protein
MFGVYKLGQALEKGMHFCHYFEYYLKTVWGNWKQDAAPLVCDCLSAFYYHHP